MPSSTTRWSGIATGATSCHAAGSRASSRAASGMSSRPISAFVIDLSLPWGGMNDSGIGRETGLEGYREYTTTKSAIVNLDDPVDWYGTDAVVSLN